MVAVVAVLTPQAGGVGGLVSVRIELTIAAFGERDLGWRDKGISGHVNH